MPKAKVKILHNTFQICSQSNADSKTSQVAIFRVSQGVNKMCGVPFEVDIHIISRLRTITSPLYPIEENLMCKTEIISGCSLQQSTTDIRTSHKS